jgi:hypothetical protein
VNAGKGHKLFENGGNLKLDKAWARGILDNSLGWTRRKATTDRKLTAEELKVAAQEAAAVIQLAQLYHPDLVVEMDETMAPWCPTDDSTYAEEGSGKIRIAGQNDKRGHTLTVAVTKGNTLLGFQNIWAGLTQRSVPSCHWPDSFVNSFAGETGQRTTKTGATVKKSNKWQNRKTIKEFIEGIVVKYAKKLREDPAFRREAEKYPKKLRILLLMDHHWSHEDDCIDDLLA